MFDVGLGFGYSVTGAEAPDAPTLSVVDAGTGAGVTASVTGTGTITLYYRLKTGTTWTTGNTRSGDGDITQGSLTAVWYEFYATATSAGAESAPSQVITTHIQGDTDSTIETAIYTILSGDTGITDLTSTRIYPVFVPQNASMPALTFQHISANREYTLTGSIGMVSARYQINCWASTYSGARELAEVVREAFEDYSGTVNTRKIHDVFLEGEGDISSLTVGNEIIKRHGKRLDFLVWFNEP